MNKEPWCIESERGIVRPASANRDGVTTQGDCNRAIPPSHCLKVKLIRARRIGRQRSPGSLQKSNSRSVSRFGRRVDFSDLTDRIGDGASQQKDCPSRTFPLFFLQGVRTVPHCVLNDIRLGDYFSGGCRCYQLTNNRRN